MKKRELIIYQILHTIGALLLGICAGLWLAHGFELFSSKVNYPKLFGLFLALSMVIILIRIVVYGKKYQELKRSLQ